MARRFTRRQFVAAAAAGITILRDSASARAFAANERVNLAHVGVGGRGKELLTTFAQFANPVVFCDVNENKAGESFRRFPDVPREKDYRRMLDRFARSIDGVVVATPDHTHAVITAAAIRAGKAAYTEKPLARTVHESRTLRELARTHKVATSMGNQGTASGPFRRALELIRDGKIGTVKEVHVWNDGGGGGHRQPPPDDGGKVPPYLNWDLWLGPARERPFHPRWMAWSQWRDFGTGQLGNWASHTANLAFMALDVHTLWDPKLLDGEERRIRIEAKVEAVNDLSFPRWEQVTWSAPARGTLPQVKFHWHNGSRAPGSRGLLEELAGRGLDWGDKGEKKWADFAGCVIVGTEGKVHATGHNATYRLLPEEAFADLEQRQPQNVERSMGHERDWLGAVAGGKPAWASFEYAAPLNEFLQLGNVATRVEGPFDYDPLAAKTVGNPRAEALLHGEYREGWSLT